MNGTFRTAVAVVILAATGCECGMRGARSLTDSLGNTIDLFGKWWTESDRDVFKGNVRINEHQPGTVLNLTADGFKKMKIPEPLWTDIKTFYDASTKDQWINEGTVPGYIVGKTTWMLYLSDALREQAFQVMQPILEEWIGGIGLSRSAVYGIRKYTNDSTLQVHVDSAATHIISAIFHIDQDYGNTPEAEVEHWPLQIQDHDLNVHSVLLSPGEMVLYESAKLIHGRPEPLTGHGYANMFCHFRPSNNEHLVHNEM
jgi:prolyl 4-hydroxylase